MTQITKETMEANGFKAHRCYDGSLSFEKRLEKDYSVFNTIVSVFEIDCDCYYMVVKRIDKGHLEKCVKSIEDIEECVALFLDRHRDDRKCCNCIHFQQGERGVGRCKKWCYTYVNDHSCNEHKFVNEKRENE